MLNYSGSALRLHPMEPGRVLQWRGARGSAGRSGAVSVLSQLPTFLLSVGSFEATLQFPSFFCLSGAVREAEHFMGDKLIEHISCATCSFASFPLPQRFCLSRAYYVKLMLFAEHIL